MHVLRDIDGDYLCYIVHLAYECIIPRQLVTLTSKKEVITMLYQKAVIQLEISIKNTQKQSILTSYHLTSLPYVLQSPCPQSLRSMTYKYCSLSQVPLLFKVRLLNQCSILQIMFVFNTGWYIIYDFVMGTVLLFMWVFMFLYAQERERKNIQLVTISIQCKQDVSYQLQIQPAIFFSAHYLYILIFTMSLFDDLDEKLNHNSLDIMIGLQQDVSEPQDSPIYRTGDPLREQDYVTYEWFWKDEDHVEEPVEEPLPVIEENTIEEMKSARAEQELKVKLFISKIKPINTLVRKVSMEEKTQAESPKKKKIRKILSYK